MNQTLSIWAASVVGCLAANGALYTYSGTAWGSLGGDPFSGRFRITATADPGNATMPSLGLYHLEASEVILDIAGLEQATFSNPINIVANQSQWRTGLGDAVLDFGILFVTDISLRNYDLSIPAGPTEGSASCNPGIEFPTSRGVLSFGGVSAVEFSAVPEPSLTMMVSGGLLLLLRRRQIAEADGESTP